MNYHRIYGSLIERAKNRIVEGYTETHHIIPKCMGGTDEPSNLVELTPEEHYLCHQLLVKMHPEDVGLVKAATCMAATVSGRKNKLYGWLRRKLSESMKGDNNPQRKNPHRRGGARKGQRHSGQFVKGDARLKKRMKEKNPCAGILPWEHPRCTEEHKKVWAERESYYEDFKQGLGYHASALKHGYTKPLRTHSTMFEKFKKGWDPCKV
jgi:hypothetical protein